MYCEIFTKGFYQIIISLSLARIYLICKFMNIFVDDGALSWSEFTAFFSDGILSNEDLQKLFNDIDTHNTK